MAKLKVGDIVIEDGNVSFDGGASPAASVPVPVPASASPPPPAPKPARRDPLEVARGLPGSPRLLVVLGLVALLASMGAIWAARGVLTGEIGSIASIVWLLLAAPAGSIGLGLVGLAVIKRSKPAGEAPEVKPPGRMAPDLFQARMDRLRPLIEGDRPDMTFEKLHAETRLTEAALVDTLMQAEDAGLVDEELNLETGDWYYRLSGRGRQESIRSESRTLEDRRRTLAARSEEKTR